MQINANIQTSIVKKPREFANIVRNAATDAAAEVIDQVANKTVDPTNRAYEKAANAVLNTTGDFLDKTVNKALEKTVPSSVETLSDGLQKTSKTLGSIFIDAPIGVLSAITEGTEKVARRILYGKE